MTTKGIYHTLVTQLDKLARHNRQGSFRTKDRYYEAVKRFCAYLAAHYHLQKLENISGKNTVKDAETAVSYLRQAANNGNAYAQYLLGKLTLMGEGVLKDTDAAYEWFAAARDNGHAYAEFFMKRMERGEQEPPSVLLSATRLLYHMGDIFRDNAPAPAANGVQIDHKRLQRLRAKKMAMGHKWNDHENEQSHGMGGMSGM